MFSIIEVIFLLSCCHAFNRTVVCRVPNQTKVLILVRGRALSTIVETLNMKLNMHALLFCKVQIE